MRIALLSDVHGNLTALEATLDAIGREAPDAVVFAGDVCLGGPRPSECLRLLQARVTAMITGNTDAWTVGREPAPERVQEACAWTFEALATQERDALAALPFSWSHRPTSREEDALLVVHANPKDVHQLIFPAPARQTELYGEVRQPDEEVVPLLADVAPRVIAHGHLHIPGRRRVGEHELVNISSVHMPGDGDAAAKFATATWERGAWIITHHRVSYDIEPEVTAFRESGIPGWERAVESIREHGCLPQRV